MNKTVECDICIIGSGFAGLSLASRFCQQKKLKVIVAEGSSSWYGTVSARHPPGTPPEQELYRGSVNGWIQASDRNYLLNSRLRTFGGTSSLWSGWVSTLDEADFSRHKDHTWPLSPLELHAHYTGAKEFLGLQAGNYDEPEKWITESPHETLQTLPTDFSPFRTRVLQLNPIRLQQHYIHLFSENVDLYRNAHLIELISSSASSSKNIVEARFQSYGDEKNRTMKVKASCFILAQGTLETTRQLLLTGCRNNWLGRNFIEHPYIWQAAHFSHKIMPTPIRKFYDASSPIFRRDGSGFVGMLVPQETFLASKGIGSFRILLHLSKGRRGYVNLCFEQFPHDRQSISLTKDTDMFGNPLLHLNSMWNDVDNQTIDVSVRTICEYLKNIDCISSFQIPKPKVIPGFHPAGTTRMGKDESEGVVDKNCLVFGFRNLYIASASVFPSCGYANPTLTIVALAHRLANHLLKEVR